MEIFRHNNPLGYNVEVIQKVQMDRLDFRNNPEGIVVKSVVDSTNVEGVMIPYGEAQKLKRILQAQIKNLKEEGFKEYKDYKVKIVPQ
ncbi:MAG TPA: hypothetical protein VI819_05680 [Patescibacteria group bacterium]|nr:hypothetical protein [Patescibacteria group bacterium]